MDQNAFEHNVFTDLATDLWVGKPRAYLNEPVNPQFENVILYDNALRRAAAESAGSKAVHSDASTVTVWRSGNTWEGFEAEPADSDPRAS